MKTRPYSIAFAFLTLLITSMAGAQAQCLPATIVHPPKNFVVPPCSRDCAVFQVGAVGTEPLRYQWLFQGLALPNATTSTLALCGLNPKDHMGSYQVVVRNDCGAVTSQVATLTFNKLNTPPVISCPSNVVAWTCESMGTRVPFPPPAGSDADGTDVTVRCVPASGSLFPVGVTPVLCTVTDACGLTNSCQFKVTVRLDRTSTVPSIHSITPERVATHGGTPIVVSGSGFGPADEILMGGVPLVDAKLIDATSMRGLTPPLPRGEHVAELRRCGEILFRGAKVFADSAPRIYSVTPATVLSGAQVTILGAGFLPETVFRVGFPSSRAGDNQLQNVRVAADGRSAMGEVPVLPEGMLYGSRALIAEDFRGRTVLEAGIRYVPLPEVKDGQFLAMEQLRAVSRRNPEFQFVNGFPAGVRLRVAVDGASSEAKARTFLNTYKDLYQQLSPDQDLHLLRSQTVGAEHLLFGQTCQGVPVFGAQMVISMNGGEVFSTAGKLLPTGRLGRRMSLAPTLSQEQAEAIARTHVDRPLVPLQEVTALKIFDLSLLTTAEFNPQLVWHVRLGSGAGECFVNAHTGVVAFHLSRDHASGGSLHDFDFDLQDAENEANANDDNCFWGSDDVDVADEDWFNEDYNGDADAVQANQHARDTYAFFHDTFNWHSYDNDSSQVEVFIHATVANAKWTGGCDLIQFATGWVDFEVMTHEFTHGIIQTTSDLIYSFQPGALNESYADIMGAVADRQAGDLNWTFAENRTGFMGPLRDLQNPPIDRLSKFISVPITNDYGGVHSNSGIGNKTAFLMANGGTFNFISMPAMGVTKMRDLKFAALQLLPNNADFATARSFEIAIAQDWADHGTHGFVQSDVCSVRNAWAAVEVGLPDLGCDGDEDIADMDGDSFPDWADNCPTTPNPSQQNSDGDGLGDACDNCISKSNQDQKDTDNDGMGDACDNDIDNDGCKNNEDQHPSDASVPVGKYVGPCCDGTLYGFEGNDSDGDGLLDCKDEDDDNDGIADAGDGCPIGNIGVFGCLTIEPCPCPPKDWMLDCVGGDCVELFAKLARLVNPDPTYEVIVDKIAMVNQRLYLFPNTGNTMEQMLNTMMKGISQEAVASGARVPTPYQLEIWTRGTASRMAQRLSVVGEFDPATVRLSPFNLGSILAVKPPADEGLPMTMGGTWFIGGDPAFADSDSDRDGLFDGWEVTHGLDPRDSQDALRDNDGDGASNRDEQIAGTDPNNRSDVFKISQLQRRPDSVLIQFNTVPGAVYQVQRAWSLKGAWENVEGTIAGTGEPVEVIIKIPATVVATSGHCFYRVNQLTK